MACACYEGDSGANQYTERGNALDEIFRSLFSAESPEARKAILDGIEDADARAAIEWGFQEVIFIAGGEHIESREEWLRVYTPGIDHTGTMDICCDAKQWLADVKSGIVRNYYEQIAAYCLGKMEMHFTQEWTGHLLFIDERKRISHTFSYEHAEAIVGRALDRAKDPDREPTPCEYCAWCRLRGSCKARAAAMEEGKSVVLPKNGRTPEVIRGELLADIQKAGAFLKAWKIAEEEIAEPVEKAIRESLQIDPGSVPGWKLSESRGRAFFDHVAIVRAACAGKSGLDDLVLAMGGTMTAGKFREWCEKLGVPVHEENERRHNSFNRLLPDNPKKEPAAKSRKKKALKEEF
jgi:hypothetical protein